MQANNIVLHRLSAAAELANSRFKKGAACSKAEACADGGVRASVELLLAQQQKEAVHLQEVASLHHEAFDNSV